MTEAELKRLEDLGLDGSEGLTEEQVDELEAWSREHFALTGFSNWDEDEN